MRVICDLDGTLIDIWEKYYYAHAKACQAIGAQPGERYKYQENIRRGDTGYSIAEAMTDFKKLTRKNRRQYNRIFLQNIETPEALAYDTLFPGVPDFLEGCDILFLATLRRERGKLLVQLSQLGIRQYFLDIGSGNPKVRVSWKEKIKLIPDWWIDRTEREMWLIGDHERDIMVATQLGIKSCAVVSGVRSEAYLRAYSPNRIIATVAHFPL
jgi:phosphoglycolate phosphatase-like HAD superfamily hydrolase